MPNIVDLLVQDHRKVDTLFTDYEIAQDAARKEEVAREVTRELSMHAAVEELLVYPAVRNRAENGSQLADHAIEEHQEVKELLADLEKMQPSDPAFHARFTALMKSVREHVGEEEGELLPALTRSMDQERLESLGELAQTTKSLMPTHPHPRVPGTATAQLLAGPLASVADRIRDFVGSVRT
jgi:hemerythrin superfamily protein